MLYHLCWRRRVKYNAKMALPTASQPPSPLAGARAGRLVYFGCCISLAKEKQAARPFAAGDARRQLRLCRPRAASAVGTAGRGDPGVLLRRFHLCGQQHVPGEPEPPRRGAPRQRLRLAGRVRHRRRRCGAGPGQRDGALPRRHERFLLLLLRRGCVPGRAAALPPHEGRHRLQGRLHPSLRRHPVPRLPQRGPVARLRIGVSMGMNSKIPISYISNPIRFSSS